MQAQVFISQPQSSGNAMYNSQSNTGISTVNRTSLPANSGKNCISYCLSIILTSFATLFALASCGLILGSYGLGGTFTSFRLILTLVSFIVSIVSLIIPLTGQLKGIRRKLSIGFSSSMFILCPIVICLLYLQISKKWSELDTTVVRGPGFYRCTINTYHPIISDLLALIGICISFFINLIPFFMGVFAHTLFGRACLPYKINYDEQYGMQVVTAKTYNS